MGGRRWPDSVLPLHFPWGHVPTSPATTSPQGTHLAPIQPHQSAIQPLLAKQLFCATATTCPVISCSAPCSSAPVNPWQKSIKGVSESETGHTREENYRLNRTPSFPPDIIFLNGFFIFLAELFGPPDYRPPYRRRTLAKKPINRPIHSRGRAALWPVGSDRRPNIPSYYPKG